MDDDVAVMVAVTGHDRTGYGQIAKTEILPSS